MNLNFDNKAWMLIFIVGFVVVLLTSKCLCNRDNFGPVRAIRPIIPIIPGRPVIPTILVKPLTLSQTSQYVHCWRTRIYPDSLSRPNRQP